VRCTLDAQEVAEREREKQGERGEKGLTGRNGGHCQRRIHLILGF
jgi:hypothetical protein